MTPKPPVTHRTLIKIISTRRTREWTQLLGMLIVLGLLIVLVGVAKVALCKPEHLTIQTIGACLAPFRRSK